MDLEVNSGGLVSLPFPPHFANTKLGIFLCLLALKGITIPRKTISFCRLDGKKYAPPL